MSRRLPAIVATCRHDWTLCSRGICAHSGRLRVRPADTGYRRRRAVCRSQPEPQAWRNHTLVRQLPKRICTRTGVLEWFLDGAPNGRFEGSLNGGRIEGEGIPDYPSGYQYIGNFRDGRPDGRGTFILAVGRRLTGFWENGQPVSP
ncbi:MAG: hypothetical protein ACPGQM_08745 [Alphaproteobacteria bacterium]